MIKILLDTNFCLIPFQFKVDIFSEFERIINEKFEVIIPSACIHELTDKKNGKAALAMLESKGVKIVTAPKARTVDDMIISLAKEEKAVVASQDIELKRKARQLDIHVISLRQKKYLFLS
jgi:rRNA-processing protein FCF1